MSGDFRFIDRPNSDDRLAHDGAHEPMLLPHFSGIGAFVDVGAHVGRYAIRMTRIFRKVHAVEPLWENIAGLIANANLNQIAMNGSFVIHPYAAWNTEGTVALGAAQSQGSIYRNGTGAVAQAMRLDTLLQAETEPIDLIKIDVEGAEAHVLEGAEVILASHHPKLIIEMHDHLFPDKNIVPRVQEMLRAFDYAHEEVVWQDGDAHWWICT